MADRDIFEEMVRAGAVAMWGSTERDATKIARMVLSAALAGRQVVDVPLREELIGCHHPAWPDPLNFDYGDGPQVNARRWLAENRDQHPQIVVRRRLVSDWTVWDDRAAGSGSGEGAQGPDTSDDDLFTDLDAW